MSAYTGTLTDPKQTLSSVSQSISGRLSSESRPAPTDTSIVLCDSCGGTMRPETSHHRCDQCGYILPCCEGAPL